MSQQRARQRSTPLQPLHRLLNRHALPVRQSSSTLQTGLYCQLTMMMSLPNLSILVRWMLSHCLQTMTFHSLAIFASMCWVTGLQTNLVLRRTCPTQVQVQSIRRMLPFFVTSCLRENETDERPEPVTKKLEKERGWYAQF